MTISTKGLPANLQHLINQVEAEQIDYKDRDRDMRSLADWLAKGEHSMVEYEAAKIIERQQQFRHTQEHGLPLNLQRLIDQVEAERIDYKDRNRDMKSLTDWLAKGEHSMVEYEAAKIIERQQQFRHTQEHGLPLNLQRLIDQIEAERIDYKDRDRDMKSLADWLAKGEHSMVEYEAAKIIERQQQFRHTRVHGLPVDLRRLIDQMEAERIDYKDRDRDMKSLADWLAKGEHSMVEYEAAKIIERQQQFRHTQVHGLPPDLQRLIDQIEAEQIDYKDRNRDMKSLADWLAKGEHSMVEYEAKKILERQKNLLSRGEA